jgi:hypothetical protein
MILKLTRRFCERVWHVVLLHDTQEDVQPSEWTESIRRFSTQTSSIDKRTRNKLNLDSSAMMV